MLGKTRLLMLKGNLGLQILLAALVAAQKTRIDSRLTTHISINREAKVESAC